MRETNHVRIGRGLALGAVLLTIPGCHAPTPASPPESSAAQRTATMRQAEGPTPIEDETDHPEPAVDPASAERSEETSVVEPAQEYDDDDDTDGRGHRRPPFLRDEAKVEVGLRGEEIRAVVRAHIDDLRRCHETRPPDAPPAGRIALRFTIGPDGRVSKVSAEGGPHDDELARCIARELGRWRFPEPRGGGTVEVSYPTYIDAA